MSYILMGQVNVALDREQWERAATLGGGEVMIRQGRDLGIDFDPDMVELNSDYERGMARVMEAMRSYRAAEMAMRRRTQTSMAMGENELLVLRFLTRAAASDRDVTPVDLARHLGVSTASMTALLDRLERSGHLARRPHPSDRRKILVSTTGHADHEMRDTLAAMHARMMQATRGMSEAETVAVTDFLHRMQCAAMTNWAALVRSRQSMQFVRATPFCVVADDGLQGHVPRRRALPRPGALRPESVPRHQYQRGSSRCKGPAQVCVWLWETVSRHSYSGFIV